MSSKYLVKVNYCTGGLLVDLPTCIFRINVSPLIFTSVMWHQITLFSYGFYFTVILCKNLLLSFPFPTDSMISFCT